MVNIFISYSSKDADNLEAIKSNLKLRRDYHKLWHYRQGGGNALSMEKIIEKLTDVDIFILLISQNSLNSAFVQRELSEAISLTKAGRIKEICPILLDSSINPRLDSRVPEFIKGCNIQSAVSPVNAAQIIQSAIGNY